MFGVTDFFFVLATMSYDHCVAICKLLDYMTIMSHRFWKMLILCCWITTFLIVFLSFCLGLKLEFCDSVIGHFFCDVYPLLKISSSDLWFMEEITLVCYVLIFITTLTCVGLSYICIIRTVLRFPSAQQRAKKLFPPVLPILLWFLSPMAAASLSISNLHQKMKWLLIGK